MFIQPFIENALWHGVSAGNKSIHIKVNFAKQDETLVCTIDDNGIGINQSIKSKNENTIRHKPLGIENIKNRIALLNEKYSLYARVDIKDKKIFPAVMEAEPVLPYTYQLKWQTHEQDKKPYWWMTNQGFVFTKETAGVQLFRTGSGSRLQQRRWGSPHDWTTEATTGVSWYSHAGEKTVWPPAWNW